MIIENWFSTQLFVDNIGELLPLAKKAFMGMESKKITQPEAITHGGITTYPKDDVFDSEEYIPLINKIIEVTTNAAIMQGIDMKANEIWITQLWTNAMNKNSKHESHSHAPSAFSGCLYVQCPQGSSPTRFHNPIYSLVATCPLPSENPSTYSWFDVPPIEGNIAVWNGWALHNVPPNESETPRYTISFNAIIKPKVKNETQDD
jgi:uncharacterized protein (TIGR02466 family)